MLMLNLFFALDFLHFDTFGKVSNLA